MSFDPTQFVVSLVEAEFVFVCPECHTNLIFDMDRLPDNMDHNMQILYQMVLIQRCEVGAGHLTVQHELMCHDCHPLKDIQFDELDFPEDADWMKRAIHDNKGWHTKPYTDEEKREMGIELDLVDPNED